MKQRIAALLKNLIVLAVIGAIGVGCYLVIKLKLAAVQTAKADESLICYNMHIRVWKDDTVRWEFSARKVIIAPDRNSYSINDIYDGRFYRGSKTYTFTSPGGDYNANEKKVNINGTTIMRSTEGGDYFKADNIMWDGLAERIVLTGGVDTSEDGNIYRGKKLIGMGEKLDNIVVTGDVAVYIPDVSDSDTFKNELADSETKPSQLRRIHLKAQRVEYNGTTKNIKCSAEEVASLPQPSSLLPPLGLPPQPGVPSLPGGLPMQPGSHSVPLPPIKLPLPRGGVNMLPEVSPDMAVPPPGALPPSFNRPPAERPKTFVLLEARGYNIEAQEIFVDYNTGKFARAVGMVRIVKSGGKPNKDQSKAVQAIQKRTTTILTDQAEYFWKEGRINVTGYLSMQQRDMDLAAASAVLLTKLDQAQLRGGVTLHQAKGDWLFKEKVVDSDVSDNTKDTVKAETTITCSSMDLDFKTDKITATGNLSVLQKKRSLTANSAVYDGSTHIWQVYGNVKVNNKGDTFSAPMFEYREKTKELLALSGGQAEVLPSEDDRSEFKDYFSDRDEEDFDPADFNRQKVSVSGDQVYYDEKNDILKTDGRGFLKFKDVTIQADHIVVNFGRKKARALGNVTVKEKYNTITGGHLYADWEAHNFTVSDGTVRFNYAGRPAHKDKKKTDPFELVCGKIIYNSKTRKGEAIGSPLVTTPGRRASAGDIAFDLDRNVFVLDKNVKIHQDNGDWLKDKDYIDADDEQSWYLAERPTDVTCDNARFETDNDYFKLKGNVKIEQSEKTVTASTAELFGKDKRMLLDGDVTLEQTSGEWLFEGKFIEKDEDEDTKKRARDHIKVTAPHVESLYGEKKLYLSGGVTISQGKSSAKAESIWYYSSDKITVLEGDVIFTDENGRDLTAKRVVYDGKKKSIEAFKGIRGTGTVEKKNR